jgi:hypothetical protein
MTAAPILAAAFLLAQAAPAPPGDHRQLLEDMARDLAKMVPQSECAPFAEYRALLAKRYGEKPVVRAITKNGLALVLTVNPKTGTWTALYLSPGGNACAINAGTGFDMPAAVPPGVPS